MRQYNLEKMTVNTMLTFDALVHSDFKVTAAAEELGVSQPSVSYVLRRLLTAEGYTFFTTTNGGGRVLGLTDQGRALHEAIKPMIAFIWET